MFYIGGSDDPHSIKTVLSRGFSNVFEYLMSFYICFDNIACVEVFTIVSIAARSVSSLFSLYFVYL